MAISQNTQEKFKKALAAEYGMDVSSAKAVGLLNDLVKYYRLLHQLDLKAKQAEENNKRS